MFRNKQLTANDIFEARFGKRMKKIVDLIVEKRKLVLILYGVILALSLIGMLNVNVNYDMSKYLPDDSGTKLGMEKMTEEYGDLAIISVMFQGLSEEEQTAVKNEMAQIPNVKSVAYLENDEAYRRGGSSKYMVVLSAGTYSEEAREVLKTIRERYRDYGIAVSGGVVDSDLLVETLSTEIPVIAIIAVVIIFAILFLLCDSWIEPALYMGCIGVAVLINMGTNAFLPSVSFMTFAVGALLQLGLSMDYSIMLINRYNQEKTDDSRPEEAMKKALLNAFGAITSSSVTTVVGLLVLVFMSFKIGPDLGVVLAKGVFISLVCIFTILPGLVIIFDKVIARTRKKSLNFKTDFLMKLVVKGRYILIPATALAAVFAFVVKGNLSIGYVKTFDNGDQDRMEEVFGIDNQIALLYNVSEDQEKVTEYISWLEEQDQVNSVQDYSNTIGKSYTYQELAEEMADMDITLSQAKMLYQLYADSLDTTPYEDVTVYDLLCFMDDNVAGNPDYSDYMTQEEKNQIKDARRQLEEGKAELAEAEQKLIDGEKELSDGQLELIRGEIEAAVGARLLELNEQQLESGLAELEDGERQLIDGEAQLADAEAEIAKNEKKLKDGEDEISEAEQDVRDGSQEIFDGEEQLEAAQEEIDRNEALLADGERQLAEAKAQVEAGEEQLATLENALAEAQGRYDSLEDDLFGPESDLQKKKDDLDREKDDLAQNQSDFEAEKREAEAYIANHPELPEEEVNEIRQRLAEREAELESQWNEIAEKEQSIADEESARRAIFDAAKEPIQNTIDSIDAELAANRAQLEEGKALIAANEAELAYGREQLEAGKEQLKEGRAELRKGKLKLEDGKDQLRDGKAELISGKTMLEAGKEQLQSGKQELADNKVKLEEGKKELEEGRAQIASGYAQIASAKAQLEQGWVDLDAGRRELEDGKVQLAEGRKVFEEPMSVNEIAKFMDQSVENVESMFKVRRMYDRNVDQVRMTLEEFVAFITEQVLPNELYAKSMTDKMRQDLEDGRQEIEENRELMLSGSYKRMMVSLAVPLEGEETFGFIGQMKEKSDETFGKQTYLVGDSTMGYEMDLGFTDELNFVSVLTIVSILVVVILTFRSVISSGVLVAVIQSAVFIVTALIALLGISVNYVALILVQCILMGSTIDYGILFISNYTEIRGSAEGRDKREAVCIAMNRSIKTIMTSSLILVSCCLTIGFAMTQKIIAQTCSVIAYGTICAVVLVIFVLPALAYVLDRFIVKKK